MHYYLNKRPFAGYVILTVALSVMPGAFAETTATTPHKTTPRPDIDPVARLIAARDYSKNNNAVGIFVNIAPSTRHTPQYVGEGLKNKFANDGVMAEYTYNYARAGASSVSFFIRGTPYTGYGFDKVGEGYALVLRTFKALQAEKN